MTQKLLLLRHGEIGEPYVDRYIGSTDLPMSAKGHRQVVGLKDFLRECSFDRCICSPMKRCRETASIIMESRAIGFEIDPALREVDFGRLEGMSFDEIAKAYPAQIEHWIAFEPDFAFPGGEKIGDFMERIRCLAVQLSHDSAETILLCTHGGVIRMLICHFLRLEPWQFILFKVKPASVTTIELFDKGGILTGLSETGQEHCLEINTDG